MKLTVVKYRKIGCERDAQKEGNCFKIVGKWERYRILIKVKSDVIMRNLIK
jgi:hypothetical protein